MSNTINSTLSALKVNILNSVLFMGPYSLLHNQYYFETSLKKTFIKLYKEGGIPRFYKGYSYMFGYTVTLKTGEVFCHEYVTENYKNLNSLEKNIMGSLFSTSWKMILYPLNTISIKKQIYNKIDYKKLNIKNLYAGCLYNIPSVFLSNFFWFGSMRLYPQYIEKIDLFNNSTIDLTGGISGICASITTDIFINPIKVLKTNRQVNSDKILTINIKNLYRGIWSRLLITSFHGFIFGLLWKRNI